ncbi:MAG: NAD(P)/FAD-dependent oxidoreductase [Bacteroidales bacterium]|nr:NAD(P)/FAD-dependent oxidoreductase [Bacteroidales bacterium]
MHNHQDVVIMGGGVGGLFTAALLAKEGYQVTVLERSARAGGGLQSFRRDGVDFDAGMHVLGGLQPGGSVDRICRYLGIRDQFHVRPVDVDCMDEIYCHEDRQTYRVPGGREAFTHYFQQLFPEEKDRLSRYMDALYALTDQVGFFHLRPGSQGYTEYGGEFYEPSEQLIARHVQDPRLRDLLGYMSSLCGGAVGHTPAYVFALINCLYINGHYRFEGPASQMADALVQFIEQHGGQVLTHAEVVRIVADGKSVASVVTADGCSFHADHYISSLHPQVMMKIADTELFTRAFRVRVEAAPNNYSAYCVYIVLKPGTFPYINHPCYYLDNYDSVWQYGQYVKKGWPQSFAYLTPCVRHQGEYAHGMQVIQFMPFSVCERWEDTVTGRRGADYQAWKQQHTDRVLQKLERRYPGFRSCVAQVYDSSPLTIRDYGNEPDGSLYGLLKDCENPYSGYVPVRTKADNLFVTGQNVYLHGCCGVPLTAVMTAEAVMGETDAIVRRL